MLGSRFDLSQVVSDIASRLTEVSSEASVQELERDVAAVAKTLRGAPTRVEFRCPVCDDPMQVRDETELSEFSGLDVKLRRLQCDTCGMLTGRVYHADLGYDARLVR